MWPPRHPHPIRRESSVLPLAVPGCARAPETTDCKEVVTCSARDCGRLPPSQLMNLSPRPLHDLNEVVYTPSRRWGLAELAPPPRAMGCHSSILAETCPNRSPKCYFEGPGIALAGRRRCRGDPEATRPRSRRRALVGSGSWEPPPTTGGRRRAPPRLSSQSWWSRDPRTRRGRQCRGCSAEMRDPEDTGGKRSYNGSEDRSEQASE